MMCIDVSHDNDLYGVATNRVICLQMYTTGYETKVCAVFLKFLIFKRHYHHAFTNVGL